MAKKSDYGHPEVLELYEKLVATIPEVDRKGKANPYTSLNGNMFSFIDKEGLLSLRLSKEDQEIFIKKYKAGPSLQYGAVMKDYVLAPKEMWKKFKVLETYFKKSYEFAGTLKVKPSAKKKKK